MPRVVYIGRETPFVGKTAFWLLANLKNFGIGRMLTRHTLSHFPEPSYHRVVRVDARMDPELKFGTIWCETVIRGKRLPGVRPLTIGYQPDFRLIPRDEEEEFLRGYKIVDLGEQPNVLPKWYSVPPLMRKYLARHYARFGSSTSSSSDNYLDQTNAPTGQFKIPFVYQDTKDLRKEDADLFWIANRLVKDDENEKPSVEFDGKYRFNADYRRNTTAAESSSISSSSSSSSNI